MRSSSSSGAAETRGAAAGAGAVAAAAALAWLALFALLMAAHGGDVSRFVTAGDFFVDAAHAPTGLHVATDSNGYDGQFFHRLALDPWSTERVVHGTLLDRGPYRQQRILYPLVARALALGRPERTAAALVAANLLALVALAGFGAAWARRAGVSPWLGLALSLQPGLALAFARDLAEPTELAAAMGALWLLRSGRPAWAALPLALAALARETSMLLVFAVGVAWLPWAALPGAAWRPWAIPPGARPPAIAWAAPLAVWLAWQGWIAERWGVNFVVGVANRGLSKSGLGLFPRLAEAARGGEAFVAAELVALLALAVAVVAVLPRSRATRVEKLAALIAGMLLLTRGESVWREDWAFLRVASSFTLFALLVVAQAPGPLARRAPAAWVAGWAAVAGHAVARGL